jgi:hypothetical protein
MSVKRIRCTDDVQKRGIRDLRDLMRQDNMPVGIHWKLQKILEKFELSHAIIRELLKRAESYQERDLQAKAAK